MKLIRHIRARGWTILSVLIGCREDACSSTALVTDWWLVEMGKIQDSSPDCQCPVVEEV